MEFVLTFAFFGIAMLGMSIGVILSNRELQGSCGGAADLEDAHGVSCGACGKKKNDICPTDNDYVRIAQLGHPNPSHHR